MLNDYEKNFSLINEYLDLDKFLETCFIPQNVIIKTNVRSGKKRYLFIDLDEILKLGLDDNSFKYVISSLKEKGIIIQGLESFNDQDFEDCDIYTTYKNALLPEVLTDDEIKAKFIIYSATKDPVIREQLILGNMRLVPYIAWTFSRTFGYDVKELEQYGYEGLISAVDHFDVNKGFNFSTYASSCIKNFIRGGIRELVSGTKVYWFDKFRKYIYDIEEKRGICFFEDRCLIIEVLDKMISDGVIQENDKEMYFERINLLFPESLDDYKESILVENVESFVDRVYLRENIKSLFNCLNQREKEVMMAKYGFEDEKVYSYSEIARRYGVSCERIRQIEFKALNKLRYLSENNNFIDFYTSSNNEFEYDVFGKKK